MTQNDPENVNQEVALILCLIRAGEGMKEKQVKKCIFSLCAQLTYVAIKAEI